MQRDAQRSEESPDTCAYCGESDGHTKRCAVTRLGWPEQRATNYVQRTEPATVCAHEDPVVIDGQSAWCAFCGALFGRGKWTAKGTSTGNAAVASAGGVKDSEAVHGSNERQTECSACDLLAQEIGRLTLENERLREPKACPHFATIAREKCAICKVLNDHDPVPDGEMPIDEGIRRYVLILRSEGVETDQSCQGGPGHACPEPMIRFHGNAYAGFQAFAIAMTYGLPVLSIAHEYSVVDGRLTGPHWRMVFRSADPSVTSDQRREQ